MRRETQRLFQTEAEEPPATERITKDADGAILKLLFEIDEDVAARHQMNLGEHRVRRQAVIGEENRPLQGSIEHCRGVARRVVTRKRRFSAGGLVVLAEAR